jgi:hypothetical protein
LQEEETSPKEAAAIQADNRLLGAKQIRLRFTNADGGISSPLISSHRKQFPDVCPEYHCGCLFLREDDVMKACSELLRQDWQRERNEDSSCRTKEARVSVRLNSLEVLILRRDDASRAKAWRQISLESPMFGWPLSITFPDCSLATWRESGALANPGGVDA